MRTQPVKVSNYINHIALVLDASSSMSPKETETIRVADNLIAHLAKRSKELDQETRVTVYTFADRAQCLVYDKDVLRMPSIKGLYYSYGNTALIDATLQALDDLAKTPELYGEHAFLVYVLTDGEENASRNPSARLTSTINCLAGHWTVAAFVPNQNGVFEVKKFGFPKDNIAVWNVHRVNAITEVGERIRQTTDVFMEQRLKGVRGYKNLFSLDASQLTKDAVAATIPSLHPGQYRVLEVATTSPISTFIEEKLNRPYKLGEAFYQLTKVEKIQPQKSIALYHNKDHRVYTGKDARTLLGLPNHEIKVEPLVNKDFTVFVQSTSVNRKLIPGQKVLLLS